jgi:hypothetical protein
MSQSFYAPEYPLVKKFHNRYRKDIQLEKEQVESLQSNFGILAKQFREKDVLKILRKKLKRYKFKDRHILVS